MRAYIDTRATYVLLACAFLFFCSNLAENDKFCACNMCNCLICLQILKLVYGLVGLLVY